MKEIVDFTQQCWGQKSYLKIKIGKIFNLKKVFICTSLWQ